jgi:hypothetical protein
MWLVGSAWAAPADVLGTALLAQHKQLAGPLRQSQFDRPLVLYSSEAVSGLTGDVYAVVAYPLHTVSAALRAADQWCDVMILHINTKYCHALTGPQGSTLRVYIGKKTPQSLAQATRVEFQYSEMAASPGYFAVMLNAKDGPLSTSDYKIGFEAVALPGNKSFLHLGYAYGVGFAGRVAMQTYLATAGADKVGFTELSQLGNGQLRLIGGVRGVVERNTMRYFLAIDSALAAQSLPPAAQLEARLQGWFTAVERYPRQLHEMDRPAYLEMKRAEHTRQQTVL